MQQLDLDVAIFSSVCNHVWTYARRLSHRFLPAATQVQEHGDQRTGLPEPERTAAAAAPRVPVAPAYSQLQRVSAADAPRNADSLRLRRAAGVLLLLFCLGTAVGLVHVIGISQQVLARLEAQQPSLLHQPHTQSRDVVRGAWQRPGEGANVLIAYSDDGTHLSKLAAAVEVGTRNALGNETTSLRVRTLENASFAEDVMWADAVVLGTHVVNANVEPKVRTPGITVLHVVVSVWTNCVCLLLLPLADGQVPERLVVHGGSEPEGWRSVRHEWRTLRR